MVFQKEYQIIKNLLSKKEKRILIKKTKILNDDSDEELEQKKLKRKLNAKQYVYGNLKQSFEETKKSSDAVKDIGFRQENEENLQLIRMEPFNLKIERKEGYFNTFGIYTKDMKNSSDDEFQNMLNNDQYSIRSQKDKRILKQHKKKWIQDHILSKLTEKRMNPIQVYTSIFIILFSCETVQISLTRLTLLKNKIYSSFQKKHICMELSKSYSESFSKLTDLVLRLTNLSEYSK